MNHYRVVGVYPEYTIGDDGQYFIEVFEADDAEDAEQQARDTMAESSGDAPGDMHILDVLDLEEVAESYFNIDAQP